jgi:hypothetical protein
MPHEDDITTLLEPGERLMWHGRPNVERLVGRKLGSIFIAGAGVGLMLLWAWYALAGTSVIGAFVALMFVAFAAILAHGKYREVIAARTTRYAVTDRRALIVSGRPLRTSHVFLPGEIGPLETRNDVHGVGDVLFRHTVKIGHFGRRRTESDGFIGIAEIGKARDALAALMERAGDDPTIRLAPDVGVG